MYRDRHDLIFRDEILTTGQKVNAQELYGKHPPPALTLELGWNI
jgi:hypothetical protein